MKYDFNLFNILFEEHSLIHVTNYKYDKPCNQKILENRSERTTHDNSVLGIWSSTFPIMCSSFGQYSLQIIFKNDSICLGLTYRDLFNLTHNSSIETLLKLKNYLLNFCDVLYILDANKYVGEVIILNLDCIDNMIDVSNHNLKDQRFFLKKLEIQHHLSFIL